MWPKTMAYLGLFSASGEGDGTEDRVLFNRPLISETRNLPSFSYVNWRVTELSMAQFEYGLAAKWRQHHPAQLTRPILTFSLLEI